jgi:hypothetical protein
MGTILAVIAYLICALVSARWYGRNLDRLEEMGRKWGWGEPSMWKSIRWTFLAFLFWWAVLPYELSTGFRQWKCC